jgi:phosphate-selective porin OprO/OprP
MVLRKKLLTIGMLMIPLSTALAQTPPSSAQTNPTSTPPADATPPGNDTASLRREIEQQEQRLRELEKRLSVDEATQPRQIGANGAPVTTAAANPNALLGSIGDNGIQLQSADGRNVVHLGGNVSVDYRYFDDRYDPATADTWLLRKARLILEGQFDSMFDFRFMPDFGQGKTVIQDAWVDARVEPWLVFTAGKFKAPVGLERLQLEQYARFIEASLTADLEPYRDLGGELAGNIEHGLFSYQVGVFDGAPDGGSTDALSSPDTNSSGKSTWDARVFSQPFVLTDLSVLKGIGLGVAGTYVNNSGITTLTTTNSLLASYKTTGQQSMFSYRSDNATTFNNATIAEGIERRLVPQAYWYYGPVYLMGEYVRETQQVFRQVSAKLGEAATLNNSAWQIQGGVFLTGEKEAYDAASPNRPVSQGGFGAWELVARYHTLSYDEAAFAGGANSFANPATAVRDAHARGIGLNWYLTHIFKIQLDYEQTRFDGGATVGNRPDERVITSQFSMIF